MRRFHHARRAACATVLLGLLPVAWAQAGGYVEVFMEGAEALEAGELALAHERFSDCLGLRGPNPIVAYHLACVEARIGDADAALFHLEDAVRLGCADADVAITDPDLESLRGDPRFERVVEDMGELHGLVDSGERAAEIDRTWPDARRALSPDGLRSVTFDGLVMDELSGAVLASLGGPELRSRPLFTPDGSAIVTTHPGGVLRVWDARDPHAYPLLRELDGLPDSSACLSIDASGARLLYSARQRDGTGRDARVLRLSDGVWERRLRAPANAFSVLAPDGRTALLCGHVRSHSMFPGEERRETLVRLVDVDKGEAIARWHTRGWPTMTGAFSSDGRRAMALASFYQADSRALVIFDVETGAICAEIARSAEIAGGAVFAGDSEHILTAGRGGRLVERALPSLEPVSSLQAHEGDVRSLRTSADGRLAYTWGADGFVRCWSVGSEVMLWERELRSADSSRTLAEGDRPVIVSEDGIHVLEAGSVARSARHVREVRASGRPAVDPLESFAAVPCSDGTARIVDLASGAELARLATAPSALSRVELGPQGRRLACLGPEGVWLFDAVSGSLVRELPMRSQDAWPGLAFRPDGRAFAAWGTDAPPALWNAATGEHVAGLEAPTGTVRQAAWSPDGALIATAEWESWPSPESATVTLRHGDTGRPIGIELPHPTHVAGLAFSADGSRIATACLDGKARVWNTKNGALCLTTAHDAWWGPEQVHTAQISSDGARLVTTTGEAFRVWDLASGELQWKLMNRYSGVAAIHALLSDDARRVYLTGNSPELRGIRDVQTGAWIAPLGDVPADEFVASGDFRRAVATGKGALQVLDGATLDPSYSWIPFEGAGYVARAPSGHFRGTPAAARWTRLRVEGVEYPLDTFASVLLDPKRVRAAARGVSLAEPRLPIPPALRLIAPLGRVVEGHGAVTIEALAEHPLGLASAAFEVERDGRLLDANAHHKVPDPSRGRDSVRLRLDVERQAGDLETTLRICAVAGSGVLSLPALVTIEWRP